MEIGFIGLGKMGGLMAKRLIDAGHTVVGYNLHPEPTKELEKDGLVGAYSVTELVEKLKADRKVVWLMVPHGDPVTELLFGKEPLSELLSKNDVVIDGGNSHYKESLAHADQLKEKGIDFVDIGTSGGLEGAQTGACIMAGADQAVFDYIEPLVKDLAMKDGYKRVGGVGAGHFVKMVHNGIEYAIVQSVGEGFELLEKSDFDVDLEQVADVWNHGSIIRSQIMQWMQQAFAEDAHLEAIGDEIGGGSTGEWTVQAGIDHEVPLPAIYMALAMRYRTRADESFSAKVVAALRNQWGGHAVEKRAEKKK